LNYILFPILIQPFKNGLPNATLLFPASVQINSHHLATRRTLSPLYECFFPEAKQQGATAFKEKSGNALGKAPVLKDGGLTVVESGAITE